MLYPLSYGGVTAAMWHGLKSIMPKTSLRHLPWEVWALVLGMFTVALGYGVVAPVLPAYAKEFGVSFAAASAIISAFAAMRLLFAPASGALVRKFGERHIYISGILIVAVSTGACAFAWEYWQLIALRAIAGIGSTMFSVSAMGLLIKLSPVDARAQVASLNSGSFMVGAIAGPVLGAIVAVFGLRAPFIFYFVLLIVASLIVGLALRRSQFINEEDQAPKHPFIKLSTALGLSQYRAALSSAFAHGWSSIGVRSALIPLFTVAVLGEPASAAGWMLSAFAIANLVVLVPAGRLADRFGRKPLILAGLFVAAVGVALTPIAHTLSVALIVVAIAGAGSALMVPAQQAVLADVVGNKARGGQVLAVFQMSTDFGAVLGPVLAGLVVDAFGFSWGFAFSAAILVLSAIVWLFTPDSKVLQRPGQEAQESLPQDERLDTRPIPTQPDPA